MKSIIFPAVVAVGMLLFSGCGNGVDENETPESIRKEIVNMDTAQIEKKLKAYSDAIADKGEELAAEVNKLAEIPLSEQLGKEAGKIKENISDLKVSLDKLKANLEAYSEGLKSKK